MSSVIRSSRLFESLTEANKKYLLEHSLTKEIKKNQYLWQKTDPGEFCVFIIEGLVEIINTNQEGEDCILGIFGPGEIVGLSAILNSMPFPASARVSCNGCRVLKMYIRSADVDLEGEQRKNILLWQREMLLLHEQILRDKIRILGAGRLHLRLIELFEHLLLRFATRQEQNTKKSFIPVPITKTQIAKIIGARVETVIRVLNKWEKAGFLTMNDKGISISHLNQLRQLNKVL
jgi:CRP-like cAMP-binding protein